MINIKKNGKFIIPEHEIFIGHAGDNLHTTKEFFVEGVTDVSLVYRMYLQFDDGSTNFFLLQSESLENGTKLIWDVTNDQIYKSGIVKMQIKASNSSGVVFHSAITSLVAHTSIEFGESYKNKENSEFLQHEQYLNDLLEKEREALEELKKYNAGILDGTFMDTAPKENSTRAVQSGGVFNALKTKLDNSDGSVKSNNIADSAVTTEKIANGSVTGDKIASYTISHTKLAADSITTAKIIDKAVTADKIADGSITADKLSEDVQNAINEVRTTDFVRIVDKGELTEITSLNDPMLTLFTGIYQFTASGDLAAAIKGDSTAFTAELRYIAPYQVVTDVETQQVYVRKVNRIAPSFSADAWEKKTPDSAGDSSEAFELKTPLSLQWESGSVSTYPGSEGNEVSAATFLRTTYQEVSCFDKIRFELSNSAYYYNIIWFDENKKFVSYLENNSSKLTYNYSAEIEVPENAAYARFLLWHSGNISSGEEYVLTVTGLSSFNPESFYSKTVVDSLLDGKLTLKTVAYSESVFNDNKENGVLYKTDYEGVPCYFFNAIGSQSYQYRFTKSKLQYRVLTVATWSDWQDIGDATASERVDITEETNDFLGSYELAENTVTVSGRISVSAERNTSRIDPSAYIPVRMTSVIGKSKSKNYIINVDFSTPCYIFTVLNMDGTKPTESDYVFFTATLFKT